VGIGSAECVEEDEIPGPQLPGCNTLSTASHVPGAPREVDVCRGQEHVLDRAAAVKALFGRRSSGPIRPSNQRLRIDGDRLRAVVWRAGRKGRDTCRQAEHRAHASLDHGFARPRADRYAA